MNVSRPSVCPEALQLWKLSWIERKEWWVTQAKLNSSLGSKVIQAQGEEVERMRGRDEETAEAKIYLFRRKVGGG